MLVKYSIKAALLSFVIAISNEEPKTEGYALELEDAQGELIGSYPYVNNIGYNDDCEVYYNFEVNTDVCKCVRIKLYSNPGDSLVLNQLICR